jgi:hypothetical protein
VLHDELQGDGFTVVAIALDEADAAREWIEAAAPSYPALVDPDHLVAERLAIYNVPTVIWIDEDDDVVRAPIMAPVDDLFREFTGVDSAVHHEQLRAWVRDGALPPAADAAAGRIPMPTDDDQLARAHRRLGAHLYRTGHADRAAAHFARAVALAPLDWTIRRGTMPLRGGDPFGPEFFEFMAEWAEAGSPGYKSADRGG